MIVFAVNTTCVCVWKRREGRAVLGIAFPMIKLGMLINSFGCSGPNGHDMGPKKVYVRQVKLI